MPISQEVTERHLITGRRDNHVLPDFRAHESGKRVINHRFVVNREQLLAHAARDGVEARSGAAGQDDALHAKDGRRAR